MYYSSLRLQSQRVLFQPWLCFLVFY